LLGWSDAYASEAKRRSDVWAVTQGGIQMGMELENEGSSNEGIEGKIKKVVQ
jgi:hypothetical protein